MSQVEPAYYEVRVRGRLGAALRAAFDDFDVTDVPAETVLSGVVADQSALHGLLERIQTYGLELVEGRGWLRLPIPTRRPADSADDADSSGTDSAGTDSAPDAVNHETDYSHG